MYMYVWVWVCMCVCMCMCMLYKNMLQNVLSLAISLKFPQCRILGTSIAATEIMKWIIVF